MVVRYRNKEQRVAGSRVIGYARAERMESAYGQTSALQKAGVDAIFMDLNGSRSEYRQMRSRLQRGDTLVLCSLDKLGGYSGEMIALQAKGVRILVVQ